MGPLLKFNDCDIFIYYLFNGENYFENYDAIIHVINVNVNCLFNFFLSLSFYYFSIFYVILYLFFSFLIYLFIYLPHHNLQAYDHLKIQKKKKKKKKKKKNTLYSFI